MQIKTRAEAEAHQRKLAEKGHIKLPKFLLDEAKGVPSSLLEPQPAAKRAKRRRSMTRPEREYSLILEARKRAGEIIDYLFEGMRLKWGEDPETGEAMWYKADFVVREIDQERVVGRTDERIMRHGITITRLIEVKGPWISERDMVRFKGCRAAWPQFAFEMHQRDKEGRWTRIQ
jgi:hypothetical protein